MNTSSKKVLIVEDHPLNLKLFRDILRAKGYETIEDRSGADAEFLAAHHQPDLIILDVLLPFKSGHEIARAIRSKEQTAHIPMIAVTALAISETHQQMLDAGCYCCLIKPFSMDKFLGAVHGAIMTHTGTFSQAS